MASANLTVTGTLGPDVDVTTKVFANVSEIKFDLARSVLSIVSNGKTIDFDYALTATVTYTISGTTATVTIA